MAEVEGESWVFDDEQALNDGTWFRNLTFEVSAQKPGFPDSSPAVISASR